MAKLYQWILLVIVIGATFAQIMMTSDEIMKAYNVVDTQRNHALAMLNNDCCRFWHGTIPLEQESEINLECMKIPNAYEICKFARKVMDEPMFIQVMRQIVFAHVPYSKIGRIPF